MKYIQAGMIFFFVLLFCQSTKAQYSFQHLDNANGLSNSCINSVYQDADHLIWFGTWDGLNYYDGTNFHVFNYERTGANKNSITSNIIYQITGDTKRNIWIGTIQGLSRFDKNTGSFTNYFYNSKKVIASGYTLAINKQDDVYTARRNNSGLYKYSAQTDSFTAVKFANSRQYLVQKLQFDAANNLWILHDSGILDCYQPTRDSLVKRPHFTIQNVANLLFCNGAVFFTSASKQLYQVGAQQQVKLVATLPHEVRAMSYYKERYHLAWASKGLGEYDADFKPVSFFGGQSADLQNIRITTMLSAENLLWLGTDGSGAFKISQKENYFGLVNQQSNGQPFHIPVRAFCRVGDELWVGTKGNGIITIQNFNKKDIAFANISSFHTYTDQLDNCVYAIQAGKDGLIYIGSDAPGITLYDQGLKKLITWSDLSNHKKFPLFGSVHCILIDRDSSVWLGLNESGLVHLKLTKDKDHKISIQYLERYKYSEFSNSPGSNFIYSLAQGSNNTIWVGCRYGGLSNFDKAQKTFRTLKAFSYNGSLSNNDVLSLYNDNSGRLWVGTSFGLNWLNEAEAIKNPRPKFQKLSIEDGLPNNTVHAINGDADGNIWLSTNKGLVRVSPPNLKIVQFKEDDGLQSNEFSDNAVWKDTNGMLFFGGIAGFNYFLPQNIHLNTRQPNLLITDLQFAGSDIAGNGLQVLTKNRLTAPHFNLGPQQNYFELNIQPITYINHQKCRYAYYLEGSDHNWHYMANRDKIVYNNLSPGAYTLKIRWSNEDGTWTQNINVFALTIRPYFWLTPLAYLVYALALLACSYFYLRYRKNKFMMRQELKMEHVLRKKDEQLHQQQLSFFTNIAHELQTPLTLISGSLDRYQYKNKTQDTVSGSYFLSVVKQEALRLQYLVMQLMEFRKADLGFLNAYYTRLDVSHLLTNIAKLFVPLTESKSLDFTWYLTPGIHVWVDKDKLEKIIYNLLSNAFKHSTNNQSVVLSVNTITEDDVLEIIISNSGCTLSDAELQQLFDQFFVAGADQQNKANTGIGLAFTRQLVTLLNGNITVQCNDGWISFKVLLPLTFVPESQQIAADTDDKAEKPSQILQAITHDQQSAKQVSIDENNKSAMIKSFDQEDKKMILVVEDEQQIRFLLKDILNEHYIVYEAATGKEALEVIHRITPDLIISDVMMPDLNGLQLCNVIKSTTASCHIPFIILSARGTIEQQTEGYECGADAYLPKPFQADHLLVRVNALLQYRDKLHLFFSMNNPVPVQLNETDIKQSDKFFIEKVVKVIEDNLNADLDGAFLQNAMNMSKIQLYRKIKTLSNMTPTELIRYLRLQKSAVLLRTSDLTVSEIFYRTGFNNKTYFFREFKKVYDCSPKAYRTQHRLPSLN